MIVLGWKHVLNALLECLNVLHDHYAITVMIGFIAFVNQLKHYFLQIVFIS